MPYWVLAFLAGLAACVSTALGAATVLFFRKKPSAGLLNAMLGFSAGVMLAACVWSLLEPAMAQAARMHSGWLVTPLGVAAGALLIFAAERALQKLRPQRAGPGAAMLILSITLHNIPEGLAIGVAFGALAAGTGRGEPVAHEALLAAGSVALGIAVQDYPEGAAVSLPLQKAGLGKGRSFLWGVLSGAVEPLAALLGALLAGVMGQALPFLLSLAAGAMLWVCLHELIPESHTGNARRSYAATAGALLGFVLMMRLDQL